MRAFLIAAGLLVAGPAQASVYDTVFDEGSNDLDAAFTQEFDLNSAGKVLQVTGKLSDVDDVDTFLLTFETAMFQLLLPTQTIDTRFVDVEVSVDGIDITGPGGGAGGGTPGPITTVRYTLSGKAGQKFVELGINPVRTYSFGFELERIGTVPLPPTLLLLMGALASLAGAGAVRRRRAF